MIRLSSRSTASFLATTTILGLGHAGAAQAAMTVNEDSVTIEGAAESTADGTQDNSGTAAPEMLDKAVKRG